MANRSVTGTNVCGRCSTVAPTYRLDPAVRSVIRRQAYSWTRGPGASAISDETIQKQRENFVMLYGNSFGESHNQRRSAT